MLKKAALLATLLLFVLAAAPASSAQTAKSSSGKPQVSAVKPAAKKSTRKRRSRVRGQQAINKDRVKEIQTALIRERYLTGKADGAWDDRTKKALARYQEDNGWQSKVVPDSRALIKLGLGPNHAGLLNPESVRPNGENPAGADGTPQ